MDPNNKQPDKQITTRDIIVEKVQMSAHLADQMAALIQKVPELGGIVNEAMKHFMEGKHWLQEVVTMYDQMEAKKKEDEAKGKITKN